MGRPQSVTKSIDSQSHITAYSYDLIGRHKTVTISDSNGEQHNVKYLYYDGSDVLECVTDTANDNCDGNYYARFSAYTPTNVSGKTRFMNGSETDYSYDAFSNRLIHIYSNKTDKYRKYTYSPAGDIKSIGICGTSSCSSPDVTYQYSYDNLHRLISEKKLGGSDVVNHFQNFSALNYSNANHSHAVSSLQMNDVAFNDYAYDGNGNMTRGYDFSDPAQITKRAVSYNAENMPVQIVNETQGLTTTIAYDGEGKRAKKTTPDQKTTIYVNEYYEVIDGKKAKYVLAGNDRIALIKEDDGTYFFHKDHLGSTSFLTDGTGQIVNQTTEFLPFGLERDDSGQDTTDYKFTDQELDASTGLYNYDARLYDPVLGTFISPDSIRQDDYDPQGLNPYAYCRNNPLKYVDPSGHIVWWVNAIGAGLGLGIKRLEKLGCFLS